jgi:hypothetical protein
MLLKKNQSDIRTLFSDKNVKRDFFQILNSYLKFRYM